MKIHCTHQYRETDTAHSQFKLNFFFFSILMHSEWNAFNVAVVMQCNVGWGRYESIFSALKQFLLTFPSARVVSYHESPCWLISPLSRHNHHRYPAPPAPPTKWNPRAMNNLRIKHMFVLHNNVSLIKILFSNFFIHEIDTHESLLYTSS